MSGSPHAQYISNRHKFMEAAERAERISKATRGILAIHPKRFWASVLFTKISVISKSIVSLSPKIALPIRKDHWDSSSVASLARNLMECYLRFFYLCIDRVVDDDEWEMRLTLTQIRDNYGRLRMFEDWNPNDPDLEDFQKLHEELINKLSRLRSVESIPAHKKLDVMKGKKDLYTQDELLARMGENTNIFRGMYRYMSFHTHSSPVAFYRMAENAKGCGVETEAEKGIMAASLEIAHHFLIRANEEMIALFPDAPSPDQFTSNRADRRRVRKAGDVATGKKSRILKS